MRFRKANEEVLLAEMPRPKNRFLHPWLHVFDDHFRADSSFQFGLVLLELPFVVVFFRGARQQNFTVGGP